MTATPHIKIANNLRQMSFKRGSFNKQAIIGTTLSALLHAAGADEDEWGEELLRGGVKGLGADVGALLGAVTGGAAVNHFNPSLGHQDRDSRGWGRYVQDYDNTGPVTAGAIGGGLGGGLYGYLLLDKFLNSLDRKA